MGNRQNCAKFQENLFRSNEIISIFCPTLIPKYHLPIFAVYELLLTANGLIRRKYILSFMLYTKRAKRK